MTTATRNELTRKADQYRRAALTATPGERPALLGQAQKYYEEAGNRAWAKWCGARRG